VTDRPTYEGGIRRKTPDTAHNSHSLYPTARAFSEADPRMVRLTDPRMMCMSDPTALPFWEAVLRMLWPTDAVLPRCGSLSPSLSLSLSHTHSHALSWGDGGWRGRCSDKFWLYEQASKQRASQRSSVQGSYVQDLILTLECDTLFTMALVPSGRASCRPEGDGGWFLSSTLGSARRYCFR